MALGTKPLSPTRPLEQTLSNQHGNHSCALKAMTIWPAWQQFEENDKGSIEVGKLADFVLLSEDPTAIDPEKLAGIKIEGTVKDGNLVYDAQKDSRRGDLSPQFPVFGNLEAAHHLMHSLRPTRLSHLE